LAWSLHFAGKSVEAQREAEIALTINPADIETYNTLAWVLSKAKRFQECIDVVDRGLKLNPTHSGLWNAKARALIDLSEWQKAIEVLNAAQNIDCDKFFTNAALGACYYSLHDYMNAERYMKTALSIHPHSQSAQDIYREIKFRKTWLGRVWRTVFPKQVPIMP
jgi:tetratricopeptide (TPR) repeat protein